RRMTHGKNSVLIRRESTKQNETRQGESKQVSRQKVRQRTLSGHPWNRLCRATRCVPPRSAAQRRATEGGSRVSGAGGCSLLHSFNPLHQIGEARTVLGAHRRGGVEEGLVVDVDEFHARSLELGRVLGHALVPQGALLQ